MNKGFKTPAQVRFTDLAAEMEERFKMNQNRIAEVTRLSRSQVSQIINGKRSVGAAALELLEREYRELTEPKAERGRQPNELHDKLDDLERIDPPRYEAARLTIESLHQHAKEREVILHQKGKAGPASSGLTSQEEAALDEHVREIVDKPESGDSAGSKPSSGAAGPRSHRSVRPHPSSAASRTPHPDDAAKGQR